MRTQPAHPFGVYGKFSRKLFLFFFLSALFYSSGGQVFGAPSGTPREVKGGKVRYMIETKTFTQAEAAAASTQGYVDLWVYVCFNQAFVDQGFITVSGGKVTANTIGFASSDQSFKMVYEDGSDDMRAENNYASAVAAFAPPAAGFCTRAGSHYQENMSNNLATVTYREACPTWAYSVGTAGPRPLPAVHIVNGSTIEDVFEIQEIEGETWYVAKYYQMAFNYNKPESFYVTIDDGGKGFSGSAPMSSGAINLNMYYGNRTDALVWDGAIACSHNNNWFNTYAFPDPSMQEAKGCLREGVAGFIRGGVVVESSLSGSLALTAACPGEAISGSLRLSAPAPGQWEDYEFSAALASASGQSAAVPAALLSLSPAPAGNFNAGNHSFSLSLSPLALNALNNPDSLVISIL